MTVECIWKLLLQFGRESNNKIRIVEGIHNETIVYVHLPHNSLNHITITLTFRCCFIVFILEWACSYASSVMPLARA